MLLTALTKSKSNTPRFSLVKILSRIDLSLTSLVGEALIRCPTWFRTENLSLLQNHMHFRCPIGIAHQSPRRIEFNRHLPHGPFYLCCFDSQIGFCVPLPCMNFPFLSKNTSLIFADISEQPTGCVEMLPSYTSSEQTRTLLAYQWNVHALILWQKYVDPITGCIS